MNILLVSTLLLITSCGCGDEEKGTLGGNIEPRPRPDNVAYAEPITPPTIATIDESGYTSIYVDCESGADANDGLTPTTAFKTLAKITSMTKTPGMKVLLKSGAVFKESLTLQNLQGTPDKPFIVDIYGGSERARIEATGGEWAVLIEDDNIRFRNIFISNKTGKRGIRILATRAGAMQNIQVDGCRFEEINWTGDAEVEGVTAANFDINSACSAANYNKEFGGIIIHTASEPVGASWYENLYVTNNEFYKVCRTGVMLTNRWGSRIPGEGYNDYVNDDNNWYPCTGVVMQGNDLRYIGGDGIVIWGCDGGFIDHNVCYYANYLGRTGQASVALWPYSSSNTVMQYNEAAYTQWSNGSSDGEGLDIDIACRNTIVQYNYVHHNLGGGILICNDGTENHEGSIVRNNVFLFNGGTTKGSMACIATNVGRTELYNNIVITDAVNKRILFSDDWGKLGNSHDFHFRNNIFMSVTGTAAVFDDTYIDNCVFENNLYYQLGNFLSNGMDAGALLYNPGITVPAETDGYDKAQMLRPGEPNVFLHGLLFDGMLSTDFAGASATGIGYLGAFAE
jgi:hypothetical protein